MLTKEYLNKINPNQNPYNAKYSEGTYKFLSKNRNKDMKDLRLIIELKNVDGVGRN